MEFAKQLLETDPTLEPDILALKIFVQFKHTYSGSQVAKALIKAGWVSKVMEHYAKETNFGVVRLFNDTVFGHKDVWPAHFFVFGDSSHLNVKECFKKRGRGPKGTKVIAKRTMASVVSNMGEGSSAFLALSIEGPLVVFCEPLTTKESMKLTLEHHVLPRMNPYPGEKSILILDNGPIYDRLWITALFRNAGMLVYFQPQFAPRSNATEPCHHLAKDWIRKTYGCVQKPLDVMWQEAYYNTITPNVACAEFNHVGLNVQDWERQWANR